MTADHTKATLGVDFSPQSIVYYCSNPSLAPVPTGKCRFGSRLRGVLAWTVGVAIVLAVMVQNLHLRGCAGGCCVVPLAAVAETSGCCGDVSSAEIDRSDSCCGSDAARVQPGGAESPELRGRCAGGCCITLAFDLELGWPSREAATSVAAPLGPRASVPTGFAPLPRPERRLRPFDRGPPLVDRGAALRASTVLLI